MGEEIDRRERMLDAALRATAELPGESASGHQSIPLRTGVERVRAGS
jgi:hypothetical protein